MKRLFNLFLLLTMFVVNAMATDYPIVVKGVTVTSSNASNVLGNGTVSYTASTNTLTLKNANIKKVNAANSYYAIYYNGGNSLNIKLVGDNYLEGYDTHGGFGSISGDISIIGDGSLTLKGISVEEINYPSSNGNLTIREKAKVYLQPIDNSSHAHTIRGTLSVLENAALYVADMNKDFYPSFSSIGDFVKSSNHAIYPNTITFNRDEHNFMDKYNDKVHTYFAIYNESTAKKYMLSVGGTQLNEYIAADVYGDGTVKYDDATKTLTLNNANLSGISEIIHDYDYYETITINLIGDNTVKADYNAISSDGASYIITGDGTLLVNGINLDEGNLTVSGNAVVNVQKSSSFGINLREGNLSVLDKAALYVYGNGKDATVLGIKNLVAKGDLVHPVNLRYSTTKHGIVDETGNLTKANVKIYNADNYKKYALEIEGVQLNELNASNVYSDGTVKYDDATKTLTLKNANISGVCDVIHDYDYNETITINLIGNNTVKANFDAISSDGANYIITGDGTLNVSGINLDEGSLTIKDKAKVNVLKSTSFAVNLRGADLSVLDNAELNAEGNGKDETFWGIGKLTLGKGFLVHPINLSYSSTKQSIVDDAGNRTKGNVKIYNADNYEKYMLQINGIQLNEINAADFIGDGSVKYDEATKTLTLNNADLVRGSATLYFRSSEKLIINLIGNSTIKANSSAISGNNSNLIITGNGTLNVSGIDLTNCNLTIGSDAKVNVLKNTSYGINLHGGELVLQDKAELNVEGNGTSASISQINNLVLAEGFAISPKNISYSSTKQGFVDESDNLTKGDIKIAFDPSAVLYDLWIAGTQVSAANANDVFGDGTVKVTKGNADIYIRLNGANLMSSSTAQKGVIYSTSDISVGCFGYCRIEAQGDVNAAIYSEKHVKVYGSALIKGLWNGICAKSVVIDYGNIDIEGLKGRGICGFWGDQEGSLKFDYTSPSVLKVKGGIEDFAKITLGDYTKMEADAGICIYDFGVTDHNYGIVTDNSQHDLYRDEITFSYGLSGNLYFYQYPDELSSLVRDSFTETIGSGTVTYDKEAKTITFNNVGEGWIVKSYVDGLTVKLIGHNVLSTIHAYGDTRIVGDGINKTDIDLIHAEPYSEDVNVTLEDIIIEKGDHCQCPLFDCEQNVNYEEKVVNIKLVNCDIHFDFSNTPFQYMPLLSPITFEKCKFSGYLVEPEFYSEHHINTYINASGTLPLTKYNITPFQKYTLTFKTTLMYNDGTVKDGEIISTSEVMEGDPITAPEPPVIPGMEFTNWAPGVPAVMPGYDASYTAMYKATTTGITDLQTTATDAPAYDLMGRRVNSNYRGIVIKNGNKVMSK